MRSAEHVIWEALDPSLRRSENAPLIVAALRAKGHEIVSSATASALRECIRTDGSLDWDAVERARQEAWR